MSDPGIVLGDVTETESWDGWESIESVGACIVVFGVEVRNLAPDAMLVVSTDVTAIECGAA